MEYKNFNFNPPAGFEDTGFYEDTPSNPREILQRQHNQTRDYINSVVDTLNSRTEGSSGSESVKSPPIEGVAGDNVYEQLKDIKRQINDSAEAVIPDASVTSKKLADEAVTAKKIKDGEITTEKFNEEAIAPFANEPININNESASLYAPLNKTGFSSFLKELAYKGTLKSIYGKTKGSKRYIVMDNLLYVLDLETGELTRFGTKTLPQNSRIAVYSDDIVYLATLEEWPDDYAYLTIYKYEREYDEIITVNTIKTFGCGFQAFGYGGIDVSDTHFFMGATYVSNSGNYNYIYKIPLEELPNITSAEIYYSFSTYASPKEIVYFDNDLYFGIRVLKNALTEEVCDLYADIKGCDSYGNLLLDNQILPIWDRDTLLPKLANPHNNLSTDNFIYNNYYYSLINKYLFKSRIS